MPSEPPRENGEAPDAYAPTAPVIPQSPYGGNLDNDENLTPSPFNASASVVSARSGDTIRPHSSSPPPPALTSASGGTEPTDDKHELERQRLLAQRSAPPQDEHEWHASNSRSDHVTVEPVVPSAPTIDEQDEYNVRTLNDVHTGSDLPQYVR